MRPAFYNRDFVIYRRGLPKQIQCGDVLIFKSWQDHEMDYVKRVAALPGDVVKVDDKGYLFRDGEEVKEAEILYGPQRTDSHIHFPYRVPEAEYFCMGDNRCFHRQPDLRWCERRPDPWNSGCGDPGWGLSRCVLKINDNIGWIRSEHETDNFLEWTEKHAPGMLFSADL